MYVEILVESPSEPVALCKSRLETTDDTQSQSQHN